MSWKIVIFNWGNILYVKQIYRFIYTERANRYQFAQRYQMECQI